MACRLPWTAIVPLLAAALVGCAGGRPQQGGRRDGTTGWDQGPKDAYLWPDQQLYPDTRPTPDLREDDVGLPPDHGAVVPDHGTPDSAPFVCPDIHEPNESCAVAQSLGSLVESGSWSSNAASSNPGSDVDWFRAQGKEGSHTCLPFTGQTYHFKVRVTVPAGRVLRVCLREGSCGGTPTCADNVGSPGPAQLDVQYKVSGTCALTDDTTAYFSVESADGKGGCATYTVAYNYD